MKTTRKLKTTAAPVKKNPTPAWAIGSATEDLYNDAKVARAVAGLLVDVSSSVHKEPEGIEDQQLQIGELANSVFKWTEIIAESLEKRLKLEAILAAAPAE